MIKIDCVPNSALLFASDLSILVTAGVGVSNVVVNICMMLRDDAFVGKESNFRTPNGQLQYMLAYRYLNRRISVYTELISAYKTE
jgi:hypothetical protein